MDRYAGIVALLFVMPLAAPAADYTVLDVQKVPLFGDPASAVVRVSVPEQVEEVRCEEADSE